MRLDRLLRQLDTLAVDGSIERQISHLSRDSRDVGPESVFVAIAGQRVDGHDFVPTIAAGAVVVERDVEAPAGATCIRVADTKRALAELAAALHDWPSHEVPVVGVTGTNGKTTITSLVDHALRVLDWPIGRIGTTGNVIAGQQLPAKFTTPEAPDLQALMREMVRRRVRAVAMEVSSIGLAQRRVDGTRFALGVFTNLTPDHLDFHGSFEAYRDAKARLFRELLRPVGGAPRALLCADDPSWTHMSPPDDAWTYGFGESATLRITNSDLTAEGTQLSLVTPSGPVAITSPLIGRFNALNVAATYGILVLLGVPAHDAVRGIREAAPPPGRLERIPDPAGRLVVVDYAHTPDALEQALRTLRPLTEGRLWVVFGCGGDRDTQKRPAMGRIAEAEADRVIVTSDNPRSEDPVAIVHAIVAGLQRPADALVVVDRAKAIRTALQRSGPTDTVLVAGKGHETYQEVKGRRWPFDDREVARTVLRADDP
ncbi:MAG: UDP-N-acetylmuramoyl-L-alanyl-D-glutamate--2,6-diaminopimelate ligase [Myxococcota bacterium]